MFLLIKATPLLTRLYSLLQNEGDLRIVNNDVYDGKTLLAVVVGVLRWFVCTCFPILYNRKKVSFCSSLPFDSNSISFLLSTASLLSRNSARLIS